MALTSLNKRTYDLRGSRIYMHTESIWHRMCLLPGGMPVQLGIIILCLVTRPFGLEDEAAEGFTFVSMQAYNNKLFIVYI